MTPPSSHQLDAYTQQSGHPRYSISHLEKISLVTLLGLLVAASFFLKTSLLGLPAIVWWAHKRGLFT